MSKSSCTACLHWACLREDILHPSLLPAQGAGEFPTSPGDFPFGNTSVYFRHSAIKVQTLATTSVCGSARMAPSVSLFAILVLASLAFWSHSHPQCLNSLPPFERENKLCKDYNSRSPGNSSFSCCSSKDEQAVREELRQVARFYYSKLRLRRNCKAYLRQIMCTRCSPWAQHIHEGTPPGPLGSPRPSLCHDYCIQFYSNCFSLVFDYFGVNSTGFYNNEEDASRFCSSRKATYPFYCYPDIVDGPTFPDTREPVTSRNCLCGTEVTSSLIRPLAAVPAGDGSGRLFIVEQDGRIRILTKNNKLLREAFLDIKSKVYLTSRRGDERGLLGMAFDPDYSSNGRFYVQHSARITGSRFNHVSRISEYRVNSTDPNRADPTSERIIMTIPQPEGNHNGGQLFFGDDGYLYIPMGDGGGAGDRHGRIGHGLDPTTLLGSMLRIDVSDPNVTYSIPKDNPFATNSTARPEIYAYGLRNPWRCSVDRGDKNGVGKGRIFCGDVGQNKFEEIDIIEKGGNYGWRAFEGFSCFDRQLCKDNQSE